MNSKNIIENAQDIAAHVNIGKDWLGRIHYNIDMKGLDENLRTIVREAKGALEERVCSEMRHTDTDNAVRCCTEVAQFAKKLLDSNVPDRLKIAFFSEFNIVGFMFDRNRKSYVACHEVLLQLINAIDGYKKLLSSADLQIWNDSTYGGAEQVPFFRGYLQGIMARVDG